MRLAANHINYRSHIKLDFPILCLCLHCGLLFLPLCSARDVSICVIISSFFSNRLIQLMTHVMFSLQVSKQLKEQHMVMCGYSENSMIHELNRFQWRPHSIVCALVHCQHCRFGNLYFIGCHHHISILSNRCQRPTRNGWFV